MQVRGDPAFVIFRLNDYHVKCSHTEKEAKFSLSGRNQQEV
jgi:hypothetical protein